eukprot:395853-Pleurochrysis_carterae.AAC.1
MGYLAEDSCVGADLQRHRLVRASAVRRKQWRDDQRGHFAQLLLCGLEELHGAVRLQRLDQLEAAKLLHDLR